MDNTSRFDRLVLVGASALALAGCGPPMLEFTTGTAVEAVAVVDVEAGSVVPDRTVVIQGTKIAAVHPSDRLTLGPSVERVDGTGRYLIPGLWDMHVHEIAAGFRAGLPLFIANGVTGIRDMFGELAEAVDLRTDILGGDQVGPRFVLAGNIVDGAMPWRPSISVALDTPERARTAVDSLAAAGAGFIKVYSLVDAEVFEALIEQAKSVGLDVVGHVPFAVRAGDASDRGMRSMTHMFGVVEGCSTVEDEVIDRRQAMVEARAAGTPSGNPFFDRDLYRLILASPDPTACTALLDRLVRNETWLVPTLTILRNGASFHEMVDDDRLAFVAPQMAEGWRALAASFGNGPAEDLQAAKAFYQRQLEVTGLAAAAGVLIMAGTDTNNPFVYSGFSLHDELELLVEAGMTPRGALAAATINPARFLTATDSMGTVAPGMVADLVLLEANPLESIANTRRISAVVANGRFFGRSDLDDLIERARRNLPGS